MKRFLMGAITTLVLLLIVGWGLLYSGVVDVAADSPHSAAVHRLIEWSRERAIHRAAASISPPADLSRGERVRRGAGNYAAMCADCHLAPGVENSEIRQGLYPTPPNLARSKVPDQGGERMAARRFWIVKHGIKASAMPAWSRGGMEDEAIWDLVAFLDKLPSLSPGDYQRIVMASDGHSHEGMNGSHTEAVGDKGHQGTHGQTGLPARPAHLHDEHRHAH